MSLAMASALIGCSGSAPLPAKSGQPASRWPTLLADLTTVWSAESGIDVLTQPAVVVRAYLESRRVASNGGSNDYLYPGFAEAVAPNQPTGGPPSTRGLWPPLNFPVEKPVVGTYQEHILRVDQNDRNVTVVVCDWLWGAGRQLMDSQYVAGPYRPGFPGINVSRFNLIAPPDPGKDKLATQEGPSKFAMTDVFGGWRIIGHLGATDANGAGLEWPDFDRDMDRCSALAPESIERRQFLTTGEHPRSDFPTLPASPGWPAESQ
jgi:hypothetical protein